MKLQTIFLDEFCKNTNLQIHPWECKDDIFFPSGNTMESCKIVTWCWCLYSDFLSQTLQKTLHNDGLFQLVQNQNPKYDSTELLSALWSWILWIPGIIASKVSSVRLRIFTRQETISQVLLHLQQSVSIHSQSLLETWYTSLYWPANYNLIQGSVGNNEF